MYYRILSPLCMGLIVCFLSGCGFRLHQTTASSVDHFGSTRIQLQQTLSYGNFYREFYTLVKQSGMTIVPRHIERSSLPFDTQLLSLSEPQFHERPLSYSSDGQSNYIMIELTLSYEARDLKDRVLSTGPIVLSRPMSIAPNALLNNDNQRTLVQEALIQKACAQLLQRLNANARVSR